MLSQGSFDPQKLRLGFVVYGAMSRRDWRTVTVDDVSFDAQELENQLVPVVRKSSKQQESSEWATEMVQECRQRLGIVLPLNDGELSFLDRLLDYGEIKPELLTGEGAVMDGSDSIPCFSGKPSTCVSTKQKNSEGTASRSVASAEKNRLMFCCPAEWDRPPYIFIPSGRGK